MSTPMMPGGFTEWREVEEEVKEICELLKHKAEEKEDRKFTVYVPLTCRSQVVAGINYEIKVYVGKNDCLFMAVFQGLPADPVLELGKTAVLLLPSPHKTTKH